MSEHYDQREALYEIYAKKAFPDPVSPLTSRQRVANVLREFARALEDLPNPPPSKAQKDISDE